MSDRVKVNIKESDGWKNRLSMLAKNVYYADGQQSLERQLDNYLESIDGEVKKVYKPEGHSYEAEGHHIYFTTMEIVGLEDCIVVDQMDDTSYNKRIHLFNEGFTIPKGEDFTLIFFNNEV